MKISKADMKKNLGLNPWAIKQKEAARKKKKKENKVKIICLPPKKEPKKITISKAFFYEFEGGFYKVKKFHTQNQCVRKYKTLSAAMRFCKVANINHD